MKKFLPLWKKIQIAIKAGKLARPLKGQVLLPALLWMVVGVMLLAVVIEVGHMLVARRQLQNDADSLAAWGAMQMDVTGVRDSEGLRVDVLSPGGASPAMQKIGERARQMGYSDDEWDWRWGACHFQLKLQKKIPTWFGKAIGVKEFTVSVVANARLNNSDQPNAC